MAKTEVGAGGRLRKRASRNPAPVFALVGIALLAAAFAVPAFDTLLVAWGGTALFVALLLQLVMRGRTVSARVTTDIYETMARNTKWWQEETQVEYVPEDGVTLVAAGDELDPVGTRLLEPVDAGTEETLADHLSVLVDVVVNDLELAGRARARITEDGATVTVTRSRVGTGELFDHPVVSVLGVGLAQRLDTTVGVESTVSDGDIVITLQLADEFLERSDADQDGEDDAADE